MTNHEPVNISTDLDAADVAIDRIITAFGDLKEAIDTLNSKRVSRDLDLYWDEPEHLWLNAFACINPTDEFAAQVGRAVIRHAIAAHPSRVTIRVTAS